MKIIRKFLIILTSLVLLAPITYFCIYIIQNITLTKSYVTYNEGQGADSFIRCNLNIFEPEFASAFFAMEKGHISFKKTKMFLQTDKEWENSYTGGTTIKNTTFPELVKMVKEDCSQFQEGGRQGETEWIHTPAPTRDEIKKDKIDFLERIFYGLGSRANEKFIEIYGDINNMTDEEKVKLRDEIEEKGLDPAVENLRQVEETRRGLSELTDNQQKAIRQKYGDWKGLSDDELLEWMKIIDKDYEEGKFNLDDY